MVDLLSDWLLPSLKTELEQMVRARREQPYGEDSQTYNDIDGEFCMMIRPKSLKVARHVLQICRWNTYERPYEALLSDSYTIIPCVFSVAGDRAFYDSHQNQQVTHRSRGGSLALIAFEVVVRPNEKEHPLMLRIHDCRFLGCGGSGVHGEPVSPSSYAEVRLQLALLRSPIPVMPTKQPAVREGQELQAQRSIDSQSAANDDTALATQAAFATQLRSISPPRVRRKMVSSVPGGKEALTSLLLSHVSGIKPPSSNTVKQARATPQTIKLSTSLMGTGPASASHKSSVLAILEPVAIRSRTPPKDALFRNTSDTPSRASHGLELLERSPQQHRDRAEARGRQLSILPEKSHAFDQALNPEQPVELGDIAVQHLPPKSEEGSNRRSSMDEQCGQTSVPAYLATLSNDPCSPTPVPPGTPLAIVGPVDLLEEVSPRSSEARHSPQMQDAQVVDVQHAASGSSGNIHDTPSEADTPNLTATDPVSVRSPPQAEAAHAAYGQEDPWKGMTRIRRRDATISREQEALLAKPDCWLPAEPGQQVPVANIPIEILKRLNLIAQRRAEGRSDIERSKEKEVELPRSKSSLTANQHSPESSGESESGQDSDAAEVEWDSSPLPRERDALPPDSSQEDAVARPSIRAVPHPIENDSLSAETSGLTRSVVPDQAKAQDKSNHRTMEEVEKPNFSTSAVETYSTATTEVDQTLTVEQMQSQTGDWVTPEDEDIIGVETAMRLHRAGSDVTKEEREQRLVAAGWSDEKNDEGSEEESELETVVPHALGDKLDVAELLSDHSIQLDEEAPPCTAQNHATSFVQVKRTPYPRPETTRKSLSRNASNVSRGETGSPDSAEALNSQGGHAISSDPIIPATYVPQPSSSGPLEDATSSAEHEESAQMLPSTSNPSSETSPNPTQTQAVQQQDVKSEFCPDISSTNDSTNGAHHAKTTDPLRDSAKLKRKSPFSTTGDRQDASRVRKRRFRMPPSFDFTQEERKFRNPALLNKLQKQEHFRRNSAELQN